MPISPEAARNALFRTDDDQTRTPTKRCPNGSVTKADLLSEVKQGVNNKRIEDNRTVLTDNDVKDVYDCLLIVISEHLQAGKCVTLRSIGSIVMKDTGTLGIATSSVFSELRKEKTAERARLRKDQNARRIKKAAMMPDGVYNFDSDPRSFFTPPKTAMSEEKMEKYIQNAQKKLRNELTKEEAKAKRGKSAAEKKEIIARQDRYWEYAEHSDPLTYTVTPPKKSQYPESWATKTQEEKKAWLKKWEDDRFEEILKAIGRTKKTDKQKDADKAKRAEEKTARIERRIKRPDAINSISPREDILDPAKRAKVRMQAVLELQREMANRAKYEASAQPDSKHDKQLQVIRQLKNQLEEAITKEKPLAQAAKNLLDGLKVDANKHSYEYLLQVQTAKSLAKEAERTVKNLTAKLDKKMTEMSSPNTHIAVKRAKKTTEPPAKKTTEPPTEQPKPAKQPKNISEPTTEQPKPAKPKYPVQNRKSARLAQ